VFLTFDQNGMNFGKKTGMMMKLQLPLLMLLASLTSNAIGSAGIVMTNDSTRSKEKRESEGHWGGLSLSAASMGQFQ